MQKSIKDVRSQEGRGVCPAQTFFGQGGSSAARSSALFGAKNFGYFEIYSVSARTKGEGVLSQCG